MTLVDEANSSVSAQLLCLTINHEQTHFTVHGHDTCRQLVVPALLNARVVDLNDPISFQQSWALCWRSRSHLTKISKRTGFRVTEAQNKKKCTQTTKPIVLMTGSVVELKLYRIINSISRGNCPEYLTNTIWTVAASRPRSYLRSALSILTMHCHRSHQVWRECFFTRRSRSWRHLRETWHYQTLQF